MDLASLKEAAANLTLYDLKAGVRKVQNGMVPRSANCPDAHKSVLSRHELYGDGGQSQRGHE
jgi:hypothetical protein